MKVLNEIIQMMWEHHVNYGIVIAIQHVKRLHNHLIVLKNGVLSHHHAVILIWKHTQLNTQVKTKMNNFEVIILIKLVDLNTKIYGQILDKKAVNAIQIQHLHQFLIYLVNIL
jgi:hypothetical protein